MTNFPAKRERIKEILLFKWHVWLFCHKKLFCIPRFFFAKLYLLFRNCWFTPCSLTTMLFVCHVYSIPFYSRTGCNQTKHMCNLFSYFISQGSCSFRNILFVHTHLWSDTEREEWHQAWVHKILLFHKCGAENVYGMRSKIKCYKQMRRVKKTAELFIRVVD